MAQNPRIYTAREIKNHLIYDKILFNKKFVKLEDYEKLKELVNDMGFSLRKCKSCEANLKLIREFRK